MRTLVAAMSCLLTVAGCAASSNCKTKCGLSAATLPSSWDCEALQGQENAALWAYKQTSKDPRLKVCGNLQGFHIEARNEHSWPQGYKPDGGVQKVNGLTYCNSGTVIIGNDKPIDSSLVHELAHVMQNCNPRPPFDESDYYHSNWDEDGIWDGIFKSLEWQGEQP